MTHKVCTKELCKLECAKEKWQTFWGQKRLIRGSNRLCRVHRNLQNSDFWFSGYTETLDGSYNTIESSKIPKNRNVKVVLSQFLLVFGVFGDKNVI